MRGLQHLEASLTLQAQWRTAPLVPQLLTVVKDERYQQIMPY
jgi:hypothetical protein